MNPQLISLPPPPPPTDLIASALFLPLHGIGTEHRGRKLRFVGQVLAFHPPTSLLLLTSFPPTSNPHSPSPTILVNISTSLMGQSPALKNISSATHSSYAFGPQEITENGRVHINREPLALQRGEWVNVVGWLEGDGERMVRKVKTSSSYAKPLPIILEAIHISNARPPPVDGMHRENSPAWDGKRSTAHHEEDDAIIIDDHEDKPEITPRNRR